MPVRRFTLLFVLLVSTAAAVPPVVTAQYFGQNVVRYHALDFKVLQTEHFDIYYTPDAEAEIREVARLAERWLERLSTLLEHRLSSRQPLILYANHPHFRQTNAVSGGIGEGTGGVTEAFKRRVVLPLAGSLEATDHVLGHELVHAFQFDITGQGGGSVPSALRLPLWFIEGMAEYLSIGPIDPLTAMWMRDALLREEMPTVDELGDGRFFPYRYGHAFWAYVAGTYGDEAVGQILKAAGEDGQAIPAIEQVIGIPVEELSAAWHASLRRSFEPVLRATVPPENEAAPLLTSGTTGGEINIGPSLSPDGRHVVFLSERSLFSIDLFLADAETGRVIRRLVRTAADPHFDSLQFISSAGGWHPDSRQFVFSAVSRGQPVLTFVDTERGGTVDEIVFEGLGEIFNPTFSPDGRSIAFSANVTGVANLFVYSLDTARLRRLTDDGFAAFGPVWSPDGRRLAFATDRFTTNLETLQAGALEVGVIDLETGQITRLVGFAGANNFNPQWTRDGRSIYFISNRQGIPNVYRLHVASGETWQVTNMVTGVSGITADSPALSVATAADRLVFSVFEGGDYNIYAVSDRNDLDGRALVDLPAGAHAAVLPPRLEGAGVVYTMLQAPGVGLPPARDLPSEPYRAGLSLDFIGPPSVTVGSDSFGTFVGGGISLSFSDMLGNHQLATAVQVSNNLNDAGGLIAYQNLKRRLNWGVALQRFPYRSGGYRERLDTIGGQPVLIEELFIDRQIDNSLVGTVSYPFSRAARLEVSGGLTYLGFNRQVERRAFSLVTGGLLLEEREDLPSQPGMTFGQGGTAFVYDTSMYGATSPILGRRARIQFGQTVGSLQFTSFLADYREYVMPVRPLTLAGRVLYSGRHGSGAEDPRLFPVFIGYQSLIRGYDAGSFVSGEGAVFDRLTGSRMMVANLEARFPLLGIFNRGRDFYGAFPVEGFGFVDTGAAWGYGVSGPSFGGGGVSPVTSVGVGLRANLFGFAILELDMVRPLDRPLRGWVWQFGFNPGF